MAQPQVFQHPADEAPGVGAVVHQQHPDRIQIELVLQHMAGAQQVEGTADRPGQLGGGEGFGENAAGTGLTHRFEGLGPGFAGDQQKRHLGQAPFGAHRLDQLCACAVGQIQGRQGQIRRAAQHRIEGIAHRADDLYLAQADLIALGADDPGLHGGRLHQQSPQILKT
jgi:hypothetical protein